MQRRGFIASAIAAVLSPFVPFKAKAEGADDEKQNPFHRRVFLQPAHQEIPWKDLRRDMVVWFEGCDGFWLILARPVTWDSSASSVRAQRVPVLQGRQTDG